MKLNREVPISERNLLGLTWPILFELFLLFMIPAVDAYYISKISSSAVAAVAAIMPITGLGMIIFVPVTQAASSIASQHLGAKKKDRAFAIYSYLILCNLALGLLMSGCLIASAKFLPKIVGLENQLQEYASAYIQMLGFGYVALALRIAFGGILSSLGHTKWNMISAVVMNLVNWALNDYLIEGGFGLLPLKVEAVALASCLAWVGALLISSGSVILVAKFRPRLRAKGLTARHSLKSILKIAIPSTLEPACFQLSQIAISRILVELGAISLTTKAYLSNITLLPLLWGAAFAQGTQVKVAFLLGQRAFTDAQQELLNGLKIAVSGATLLSLLLLLGSNLAFGLFTDDSRILDLGYQTLWIALILEWGRSLNVVVGSALRASGDAQFVAAVGVLSMWIIAVGGSSLLAGPFGLVGIWTAMACDEHFRGWISLWRWKKGVWRKKVVYAEHHE